MVLMISVKNACQNGWFLDEDSKELLSLANEIGSSFCSGNDINTEASSSLSAISTIMSRFYPQMKMGQILAFLEVKPGYGTYLVDFHISKDVKPSPEDKIRLFVAQTDNMDTSSCVISPPQVSFLLNGKGVERRTNVFMDTGPQIPTVVMHMLKYGTNLLQAVGQFNGNYIIMVAYMSLVSTHDCSALPDYMQPAIAALDSDSEIIEGPSRISLNCPISFRRIVTPVKGCSCKHLQCFDFDNYVDINSRRPSWRCPHCNQFVCFTDICVDQNMVKVLKEVGENVADVIISADGSWKAVTETEDPRDQPHDKTPSCKQDRPAHQESTIFLNTPPDILDLTKGNDAMDAVGTCGTEDRKPFPANCPSKSHTESLTINPNTNHMNEVNQISSHAEDDFWSGVFLSTYGSGTSTARSDVQITGRVSEPAPTNYMLSPVLTDAVSPALNHELEAFHGNALLATPVQNQISVPNNMQLQQSQFGNSVISNEYGRVPSIPRHVSRTPIAVQALPAQTSTPVTQQRGRNILNILPHIGPSAASVSSPAVPSIGDSFNTASSNVERQQQFSRSHLNSLQLPHAASSLLQPYSGTQLNRLVVVQLQVNSQVLTEFPQHFQPYSKTQISSYL
ncbi:unnamed protein product [Ilex paraguariensis]|uniref:SP-RING-type domain-containing protein n=1 Tax=Ilex paraguariensis TaxID=185542 RepID=A0ABC8SH98_9AQUA